MEAALVTVKAPVRLCFLGRFQIVGGGPMVSHRSGRKTEQLLGALAMRVRAGAARDELLTLLWPSSDLSLAAQSLNTLVYTLNRTLREALAGRPPVVHASGRYRLNVDAGLAVDFHEFEAAADAGDRSGRAGDLHDAIRSYDRAAELYHGDLVTDVDVHQVLERERLRARYLSVRAQLAAHHFANADYTAALTHALDLLAHDPCREDAHRIAMRCYVRRGERAQAMRQYGVCREILAQEFDARPEPMTDELLEMVRLDPGRI